MLVDFESKKLNLYTEPIRANMSSWIEQDILVPDTKPDAIKIITVTVNPYVTDTEISDNKLKVIGKLHYYVIYRTDDSNMGVRGLYISLPYTQTLNIKNVKKGMEVNIVPAVKNIIYSLPNERKIAIKTEVMFKVESLESVQIDLIQNFSSEHKIELKEKENKFNNLVKVKSSVIASKEDIMMPQDMEDFYEILKVEHSIVNTEYKESFNKVMVKGDISTNILYLVDSQNIEVRKTTIDIPFSGMVELDDITDKSMFNIEYVISDFNIMPNIESKTMTAEYQIGVNISMHEEEYITYVDDFYSEDKDLSYEHIGSKVVKDKQKHVKSVDIKETISNVLTDNSKILDYVIDVGNVITKNVSNNLHAEGNIKLGVLIQNLDNLEIENKVIDILVNNEFLVEEIKHNSILDLNISTDKVNIMQNANEIDVRLKLNIHITVEDVEEISVVNKIEAMDLDHSNLDSMNIYIVQPKDTLWGVAKKYKTTVEKIIKTNDLSDKEIAEGQKILIIR